MIRAVLKKLARFVAAISLTVPGKVNPAGFGRHVSRILVGTARPLSAFCVRVGCYRVLASVTALTNREECPDDRRCHAAKARGTDIRPSRSSSLAALAASRRRLVVIGATFAAMAPATLLGANLELAKGESSSEEVAVSLPASPPIPVPPSCPRRDRRNLGMFTVTGRVYYGMCLSFDLPFSILGIEISCKICQCSYIGRHPRTYKNITWKVNIDRCDIDFPLGIEV